jgi:hypothetical protein
MGSVVTSYKRREFDGLAAYSRFGRGLGNGTGDESRVALFVDRWMDWATAGATRKAAIGSLDCDWRTTGDFWIEPVISSLGADNCFPPLLILRKPTTPHTRIATHRTLSTIRPPELSHRTAKK